MTQALNVTVEQLGTKLVTTKYGVKPTYSFKASGEWYSTGFKESRAAVGDTISFDFREDKYGKQADIATFTTGATGGASVAAAVPGSAAVSAKAYVPSGKGMFPIGPLDGQRSIVRQNSLTNARELYVAHFGGKPFPMDMEDVHRIIAVAHEMEGYSTGDTDLKEVEAEQKLSDDNVAL